MQFWLFFSQTKNTNNRFRRETIELPGMQFCFPISQHKPDSYMKILYNSFFSDTETQIRNIYSHEITHLTVCFSPHTKHKPDLDRKQLN